MRLEFEFPKASLANLEALRIRLGCDRATVLRVALAALEMALDQDPAIETEFRRLAQEKLVEVSP